MVKIAIKVDWMNMRVEFSPNLSIVSNKTESDKTVFEIEHTSNYGESEFPAYSYNSDELDMDEVYDDDDKFWIGLIDLPGAAVSQAPSVAPAPTTIPAPVPSFLKPAPAPLALSSTPPSAPPNASEPVSPINTMAGGALYHKKPSPAPMSVPQKIANSPTPCTGTSPKYCE